MRLLLLLFRPLKKEDGGDHPNWPFSLVRLREEEKRSFWDCVRFTNADHCSAIFWAPTRNEDVQGDCRGYNCHNNKFCPRERASSYIWVALFLRKTKWASNECVSCIISLGAFFFSFFPLAFFLFRTNQRLCKTSDNELVMAANRESYFFPGRLFRGCKNRELAAIYRSRGVEWKLYYCRAIHWS